MVSRVVLAVWAAVAAAVPCSADSKFSTAKAVDVTGEFTVTRTELQPVLCAGLHSSSVASFVFCVLCFVFCVLCVCVWVCFRCCAGV